MVNIFVPVIILSLASISKCQEINITQSTISLNNKTTFNLQNYHEYIIEVKGIPCNIEKEPPRVYLSCRNCKEVNPVLVVVRQKKGVLSWELPLVSSSPGDDSPSYFYITSRTLCPYDIEPEECKNPSATSDLSLSLSTASPVAVQVTIGVTLETAFELSLLEAKELSLTPATPRFYAYKFPVDHSVDSVLLRVQSPDDSCMTVSIQHIHCPVYDLERNVQFDGYWQSVTRTSGITISKDAFPNGFYAVFVGHAHDEECLHGGQLQAPGSSKSKHVTVSLVKTISVVDYFTAVASALATLIGFCVIISILAICYMRNLVIMYPGVEQSVLEAEQRLGHGSASVSSSNVEASSTFEDAVSVKSDSSLDETDYDVLVDRETDKDFMRSKAILNVCDLSRKTPIILGKKTNLYLWYLITVAIFYFLPVVQLVITYQKVLHTTGDQNLCYYNFLCAHPLGIISDFNHVFSNISYLILGGLFIIITRRRQIYHENAVFLNKNVDKCYGIPQHFGLFYAMGTALMVEGILSACYHVCPNHYNFQFDTSFMYVISTMCMLKIYHTRHPDVSASAYATFAMLAATILFGMCGVLYGTPVFWTIFTVIHLSICFILSIQIYYLGCFRLRTFSIRRVTKELFIRIITRQIRSVFPTYPSRFSIILAANLVNWALAALGPMYKIGDFATYLLGVFMINLMLYCTFYIIMKICVGERIGKTPALFIIFSTISWGTSLYFFFNKSISWKLTPAQSKIYNQPCKLLQFYDNHDIWHFLSAASMFFSFMVLLTLDDDLLNVPRDQIAVF